MGKKSPKRISATSEHRKNFVKLIDKLAYRHSRWNVFNDFLELSAVSFSNADTYCLVTDRKTWEEREKRATKTISKYTHEEQQIFPKLLAELTLQFEDDCPHYRDVLGETFHAMEFHDEWKGQFFTPQPVSDMIGMITVDTENIKQRIKERGFFTALEPCCGSGSMILGLVNAIHSAGINHSKQVLIQANDIDERCVFMTYLQLTLAGVPAIVQQKDSLSFRTYGAAWYTPVFVFDGWKFKMQSLVKENSAMTDDGAKKSVTEFEKILPVATSEQLSLF